ncbi:GH15474 [Drosophila grimshawi]|uniref:GH15474 n=1 Tax=Drosophila grimshawi TaxID=7222 RepID=B4J2B7_DROGR|nr:GH15474 [Drosophila grimshawi]
MATGNWQLANQVGSQVGSKKPGKDDRYTRCEYLKAKRAVKVINQLLSHNSTPSAKEKVEKEEVEKEEVEKKKVEKEEVETSNAFGIPFGIKRSFSVLMKKRTWTGKRGRGNGIEWKEGRRITVNNTKQLERDGE